MNITTPPAGQFGHQIPRHAAWSSSRGFTFVEVVAVLAVLAVLAGTAVPTIESITRSVQLRSASSELLATLYLARSEAIKRKSRVVLCKSADGLQCKHDGTWSQGWVAFHDANNNAVVDSGEAVLQRTQSLNDQLRITGNQNVANYVSFSSTGTTKLVGGGFQAGTLTACHRADRPTASHQIILNATGRPRLSKTSGVACA